MKVQFLKDTSTAKIDKIFPGTLLIYHEDYILPEFKNVEYMKFEKFKNIYSELEFNMLIIIGLNRIITPSNRCNMVNDYIQTMTSNVPKYSIDNSPFIGEPWRLWYHYDVTKCNTFNIPHGFAIETEWQHWFYRDKNYCRLSGDNIKMFISDTYSDLDLLKTKFEFYDPEDYKIKHYDEMKKYVLNKYNSPKLFINNLLKLSNEYFKVHLNYDSYRDVGDMNLFQTFCVPDVGIYRFMVEENIRRMNIYNSVIS